MNNPYLSMVQGYAQLMRDGRKMPLGGIPATPRAAVQADAPKVLLFAPHPDDECIIGGLALRLQREAGMRVINVAVTQGSRKDRQAGRWDELTAACNYLNFELVQTAPGGLELKSSSLFFLVVSSQVRTWYSEFNRASGEYHVRRN